MSEASDRRLAVALHDLDAAMNYNRCSFARTWGGTAYGERFEDNPMGCVGMHRRTKDARRHNDSWMARVPLVRAVVKELMP